MYISLQTISSEDLLPYTNRKLSFQADIYINLFFSIRGAFLLVHLNDGTIF